MTSEGARRLSNKGHQRTSSKSSSTATTIHTPTTSSPSISPTTSMPTSIDALRDDMDHTHLNGTVKSSKRTPRAQLNRKASTPMMPAFMVSAPGKVIVFGEHAVVHGKVRANSILIASENQLISTGRHCCSNFSSILPSRHRTLQVETNNYIAIP
jgi:hypothetical protein